MHAELRWFVFTLNMVTCRNRVIAIVRSPVGRCVMRHHSFSCVFSVTVSIAVLFSLMLPQIGVNQTTNWSQIRTDLGIPASHPFRVVAIETNRSTSNDAIAHAFIVHYRDGAYFLCHAVRDPDSPIPFQRRWQIPVAHCTMDDGTCIQIDDEVRFSRYPTQSEIDQWVSCMGSL